MEAGKQAKAKNAELVRSETLTFRLNKQLRSLAEVAARHKGVKLANYVEGALEASLTEPMEFLEGQSIAAKARELYDDDDATCFLKRTRFPWAMDPAQKRLDDLVRTSRLLYSHWNAYNAVLIKQYWNQLWAIAEGSDDLRALPAELFEGVDIEFALMSEAERIALYQKDPAGCAERTQAYFTRTKRIIDTTRTLEQTQPGASSRS
jgi:hypothetical protein